MSEFSIIGACDLDFCIGANQDLPWPKLNIDMRRFIRLTKGNVIIMGRLTWDSLNRVLLSKRTNIVITREPEKYRSSYPKHIFLGNLREAVELCETIMKDRKVFCIGGEMLFDQALKSEKFTKMYLTRIHLNCCRQDDARYFSDHLLRKNFTLITESRKIHENKIGMVMEYWERLPPV